MNVYRRKRRRSVTYYEYYRADNTRQLEFKDKRPSEGLVTRAQVGEEEFENLEEFSLVEGPERDLLEGKFPNMFQPNNRYGDD